METGLVIGKFYPLHVGHIALIEFAKKHCTRLVVLVCASDKESIEGSIRQKWIQESFSQNSGIDPVLLNYSENELPNTSVSSEEVSKLWSEKISAFLGHIDVVVSSEPYGDFLAKFLNCKHVPYEPDRNSHPISSTEIRYQVHKNWNYLATAAKPYFLKRICIYGTESTGKSILSEKLARYYETDFVPEMARDIVEITDEVTYENLIQIAELQAKTILEKAKTARRYLFVDTDLNITRSYSKFLFNQHLKVDDWVVRANQFHLYLYLENDVPFIQDGTRLDQERRNLLNTFHKSELQQRNIAYEVLTGDWDDRFIQAIKIIDNLFASARCSTCSTGISISR